MVDGDSMKTKKSGNIMWLMRTFYFLFYMGIGVYTTYITIYFQSIGLSSTEIGLVQGIAPVVSMLGLSLAGSIADQTGKMNVVLSASLLLASISALFFPVGKVLPAVMLISTFYTFVSSPLLQLSDAFSADNCKKEDVPFNTVKICGTIGYALIVLASGYILKANVSYMFIIQGAFFFVSSLLALKIPDRRIITKEKKAGYSALLKEKSLYILYLANLLVYISISYYNSFFPIYIKDLASGSLEIVAVSNFLALLSEFPFLIFAHTLCRKFGSKKILLVSCILMIVRWTGICFSQNATLSIALNLLKGASDIVFVYCTTEILNRRLNDKLKGTGQAFLGILTYGIARIVGNYGGGILSDAVGIPQTFLICAIFPIIAFIVILFEKPIKN